MSKVIVRENKFGELKERKIYKDFNEFCEENMKYIYARVKVVYDKYKSGFNRLRLEYEDCVSIVCVKLSKVWCQLNYEISSANTFVATVIFRELGSKLRDNGKKSKFNEFGADYSTDYILENNGDSERENLLDRYTGKEDEYHFETLETAINEILDCGNSYYYEINKIILYKLADGFSFSQIADYLTKHGYKTKQRKDFTRHTVYLRVECLRKQIIKNKKDVEIKELLYN
nr:MAG TPA: Sigma24, RpoE, Transcriptional activator chrR sigma factor, anti-sigma factor.4A [Caudoviricetes sp.]